MKTDGFGFRMGVEKKRTYHKEIFLAVLITAAIFTAAVLMSRFHFVLKSSELLGKEAPEIKYIDFDKKVTSLSEKKGVAVLIYFWALWCHECLRELPTLGLLEKHFATRGFLLLAFDLGGRGEKIYATFSGGNLPRNLIFQFSKENLGAYQLKGLPLAVLIDDKGIVQKVYSGPTRWMDINTIREIESVLQ